MVYSAGDIYRITLADVFDQGKAYAVDYQLYATKAYSLNTRLKMVSTCLV